MILNKIKSFLGINRPAATPPEDKEYEGKVTFVNYAKGYGFIQSDAFEQRVFMHFTDCEQRPKKGNAVTFKVTQGEKGMRAKEVRRQ